MNSKWTFGADQHETGLNDEVEDLNEQTKERPVATEGAPIPPSVPEIRILTMTQRPTDKHGPETNLSAHRAIGALATELSKHTVHMPYILVSGINCN